MGQKFFGNSMNDKEALKQELQDHGMDSVDQWKDSLGEEKQDPSTVEAPTQQETEEPKIEKTKTGEIDNEKWQECLNTAFQQGDFELIKTLQKVRPGNSPSVELVRAKMHELITTRPSNWVEDFGRAKSVSDTEPEMTLVAEEFGKLLDQFGQEKEILEQLKSFKQATGYNPSTETIQTKYRNIFAGKKSYSFDTKDLIEDIKTLTGIQPDKAVFQEIMDNGDIVQTKKLAPVFGLEVTSEMIQQAYEAQFAKNGYLDIYLMFEIGERPKADLVARLYQRILEKRGDRWMDSLKSLEQATGVKPTFTEEQMRPIFKEFLQRGWYSQKGYVGIPDLIEMTGLKPPVDIVEEAALKVIDDGGYGYIDQGKAIKEGLARLKESVGVDFEIPESEIQARYQKAVADKKAHVINNLYGALGIRPQIDKEEANQFMLALMDDTYHNPIAELEKVFGVKFKPTKEEIEAKQDELLGKQGFDGLVKIKELIGKDYDPKKIEAALVTLLEKEATVTSEKRGDYSRDWEKRIKKRLEQFGVTIPAEVAIGIYSNLIHNETAHSDNLKKVFQITSIPVPKNLTQQAYRKYLASEYAYSIKTGQGSSIGLGSVSSAFEELFKITGIKPEIPADQLQTFYRGALEEDSWYGRGISNIKKIAEITGIRPEFDPNDINQLYKQWILSGREDRIRKVKDVTGIELQLDQETSLYVSQQIEARIDKVRPENYEKKKSYSEEKEFDSYGLEQDLRKVGSLSNATGVKPDAEKLQSVYSEILSNDPYWLTKIEQIVKATGIKPSFSSEQLHAKGEQLLEKGAMRSFERLQAYGQIAITPELAEKTFSALITTNRRYDEYDRKHYYNEDWVDRIKRFKETTGIAPTETQLAEIFFHISSDGRRVDETIKFFTENFQTGISGGMVKDIAVSYLAHGDVNSMKKFIEKVGINPELTDKDFLSHTSRLLEAKELNSLAQLKQEMKLARIPVTETGVQDAYQHFASQ